MHGWTNNDVSIVSDVRKENSSNQLIKFETKLKDEKVLGLKWSTTIDELTFSSSTNKINREIYLGNKIPTKRQFLKIIMSIFNPLGFLTPLKIQSQILMQNIWRSKIGWDKALHESEFSEWKKWLCNLKNIENCRVERCYQNKSSQTKSAELHIFCNASSKAYAAVGYWRFTPDINSKHVSFIYAKSRVIPINKPMLTIPRLELQAAILAIRLATIISKQHGIKITRRVFWLDSKTILNWIRKDPREFKVFVANRLAEIRKNSDPLEWRWVPTAENSADDGTRHAPDALEINSKWLSGPRFLNKPESLWPTENWQNKAFEDKSEYQVKEIFCALIITCQKYATVMDFPRLISRFSSWLRLVYTIMRVFRAIDIFRKRASDTTTHRETTEEIIDKYNSMTFSTEISALKCRKHIPKNSENLQTKLLFK